MAKGENFVSLVAALARTPELRYTPGGVAVLDLVLAGNDQFHSNGRELDLPVVG